MADQEILYVVKANNTQAIQEFNKLGTAQENVAKSTQRLQGNTQNSNMLLMSTGRIIQDMPYGFMAVGNNITFMAEQMGYMRSQGMGMKDMLLGMVNALKGPMGIIFAISTATSLLTMFTRNSGSAKTEVKSLTEALKAQWDASYKARKEWEKFSDDLEKFSTADLIESLHAIKRQMNEITISATTMILATLGFYGGLAEVYAELAKLQKEAGLVSQKLNAPKILGWEDVPKAMQEKWKNSFKEVKKDTRDINDLLKEMLENLTKISNNNFNISPALGVIARKKYGSLEVGMKNVKNPGLGISDTEIRQQYEEENRLLISNIEAAADVLRSEFISAWEDIFGEANSLFEKLMMRFTENLLTEGINWLSGGVFGFVGGLLGLDKPVTPQVINVNMGNENVERVVVKGIKQAQQKRLL
jgi:hypothetical protein